MPGLIIGAAGHGGHVIVLQQILAQIHVGGDLALPGGLAQTLGHVEEQVKGALGLGAAHPGDRAQTHQRVVAQPLEPP